MSTPSETYRRMLDECACLNIRRAARLLTQHYDCGLAEAGIRSTQLPLLVTTALHGSVNVGQLAEEVVMDRTTVSRTLRILQDKGWVKVSPGTDQRTREVELTSGGQEVLDSAVGLWQIAQDEIQERLGYDRTTRELPQLVASLTQPN